MSREEARPDASAERADGRLKRRLRGSLQPRVKLGQLVRKNGIPESADCIRVAEEGV